jgi:tRNA G18 (ribose-2'-O)-methylase SpoU
MNTESVVILHDIRSAQNVGAILRTCEAVGITKVYMSGYTPTPLDRFNRKRTDVSKAALGAEEYVSWESVKTLTPLIKRLKKEGHTIIAIEQSESSIPYTKVPQTEKMAFLVGNEVTGLSKKELGHSDYIAEIPMKGRKESLNVSVACGIALYAILRI